MDTTELSPSLGVEVAGFDAGRPLDPATKQEILDLFRDRLLIVFRDQEMDEEKLARFAMNFGELEGHLMQLNDGKVAGFVHAISNIGTDGKPTSRPNPKANYYWHTDKSYHATPSLATMLYGLEIPPAGGDTQYANMHEAYDALSEEDKAAIEGLKVVHSWEAQRRNAGEPPATPEEIAQRPPVAHPLVRVHPDTGRKALYMGIHTSHVDGMPEAEGRALLDRLTEGATREDAIYTHEWRPRDLIIWDNRSLLHRARSNYEMERYRRVLLRTVVKG